MPTNSPDRGSERPIDRVPVSARQDVRSIAGKGGVSSDSVAASSVYTDLTRAFNASGTMAILSSGQACVMYRLAFVSKEGDWILRETDEACRAVLTVLAGHGARYRLGAPLSPRWLSGGWSAHCEYQDGPWRIRTDFVSRPPRIEPEGMVAMWRNAETHAVPIISPQDLIRIKRTMREKDYPIIGALAQRFEDPEDILRFSLTPPELARTAMAHPELVDRIVVERPLLRVAVLDPDRLPLSLAEERLEHQRRDRRRIDAYQGAMAAWSQRWTALQRELDGAPLLEAHERMMSEADGLLPDRVDLP